jgi:predicted lipoprotein
MNVLGRLSVMGFILNNALLNTAMSLPYLFRYCLLLCLGSAFLLGTSSCSDETEDSTNQPSTNDSSGFNREQMLADIADNQIVPTYQALSADLNDLVQRIDALDADSVDSDALQQARETLSQARLDAQKAAFFHFGPSEEWVLRPNLMFWPVDTQKIEERIDAEQSGLGGADFDLRSLASAEYLLHRPADAQAWFDQLQQEPYRLDYLREIVSNTQSLNASVLQDWNDEYRDAFVNDKPGSSRGSALSMLVNEFNFAYESIKSDKVRFPAGLEIGQQEIAPEFVEAPYSRRSLSYARAAFTATQDIFYGEVNGQETGLGLADYWRFLDGEQPVNETTQQIDRTQEALDNTPAPLYTTIQNDQQRMEQTLEELQQMVRYFKTDMASAMGVVITFADNDGD